MSGPLRLWHYTCNHGVTGITADGFVKPSLNLVLTEAVGAPVMLAWFTDLDVPFEDALGLTSFSLACDRKAYRFAVTEPDRCTPWAKVRGTYPRGAVARLEECPGAMPMHWWVAAGPVGAVAE